MDYPLHNKLKENRDKADVVGEFLDFLQENELNIAKYTNVGRGEDELFVYPMSKGNMIGMFLGIDPSALEAEKIQMLNKLRQS